MLLKGHICLGILLRLSFKKKKKKKKTRTEDENYAPLCAGFLI